MQPNGNVKRCVFLDRDGVINQVLLRENLPYPPRKLNELLIMEGVRESISVLYQHGFEIVVVTNQPDVGSGILDFEMIDMFHSAIARKTGLTNFYVCAHVEQDKCECRKPKIGLFKRAAKDLDIDLSRSFMVGDRWRDIEAGQNAGCKCFFINNNYAEQQPTPPFYEVTSLMHAVSIIVAIKGTEDCA